ncbi:O-antigen ligase family protein [Litchfieldella xinjiangensis]|uniref:O-antigen ligase family protein n=1 Tax=Litchfieldella xinjiangensis TaxID=1166948 RepID=UPI0005BB2C10|nr:hypothetical protein [Halomonas xinjiangensis]
MNYIASVFMFLGLSLGSLYVFPSGNPQPGDFVLLLFVAFSLVMALRDDEGYLDHGFVVVWGMLVFWVSLVCVAWMLVHQSDSFFRYAQFFIYNLLVGVSLIRLLQLHPGRIAWVEKGIIVAILICFAKVVFDLGTGSVRAVGTFNNPNQLAYFSLCSLVILLTIHDFKLPARPLLLVAIGAAVVSIFSASSLAAMSGMALLFVSWGLANASKVKHALKFLLILPVLVAGLIVFDIQTDGKVRDNVMTRLDRAPSKLENMYEERKYERIVEFYHLNILGAGEGSRERFYPYDGGEIHSSFGNMLFSYGIPGLSLFLAVIFLAVRRAPLYGWVALSGPLLYAVSHNGFRTSIFWIMLVVLWHVYQVRQESPRLTPQPRHLSRFSPDALPPTAH